MTTRVHIVNFGPDVVKVVKVEPLIGETPHLTDAATLYPQQSCDEYVHAGQELKIVEVRKP